jgi:Fe-S cluster assembly protein SufD
MTALLAELTKSLAGYADAERRVAALAQAESLGMPTTSDEVWRYAPLAELDLAGFRDTPESVDASFIAHLTSLAGMTVTLRNGALEATSGTLDGVRVTATDVTHTHDDFFGTLGEAVAPAVIRLDVSGGIEAPIVIVQHCDAAYVAPHVVIALADRARATVLEVFVGGAHSLVLPRATYKLGSSASLTMVTAQQLADTAWYIAQTDGELQASATLRQSVIGLGARYNRSRNDATFLGAGAHNELLTTYLGRGAQVHDFRTHQHHMVGRTTSSLLSKGAVADTSRSIYTGLIDIERGAKRVDARQTNHNLLLSAHAHADTVPNLDIKENDVACAHASSVGPLDPLQCWYLESRGVPRPEAERLIVQGFFNETLAALPTALAAVLEEQVAHVLASVVAR